MLKLSPLSPGAIACLEQLFMKGPIWDGNIVSKCGRDELIKVGFADRTNGFAFLTREGVQLVATCWEMEKI